MKLETRSEEDRSQASAPLIGRLLVERDLLSPADLAWALGVQATTGSRLGAILVAAGLVSRIDLYTTLAQAWGSEFVDLASLEIDPRLLDGLDRRQLAEESWFPVREQENGTVLVATASRPSQELAGSISKQINRPVELAVTSDWDIVNALGRGFKEEILDTACLGLWQRAPEHSARRVLTFAQVIVAAVIVAMIVWGLLFDRVHTCGALLAVISMGFFVTVAFKFVVCFVGARHEGIEYVTELDVSRLKDIDLPVYTVLVPVYKEANVIGTLIENLRALEYPAEKLDILLLLEDGDSETREAAIAARPPANITFLTIPKGVPQTKPKACNVGLFFARGEYLVIYDAEDKPDPNQLKKALIAFERGDESLVCVQAALNYFNASDSALTRMFTLEYSFWFDYMLPGLDALKLPIPLGGTSNHFRTQALRRLGGWDPFNVTEDADLGIRSAALGETVGVVSSTTYEEANNNYANFIRQRSRWIKGYMQTSLVHSRHPLGLIRQVGFRQALGFALLVGGTPLSFLFTPPLYALFIVSLIVPPGTLIDYFPAWVIWTSLANLLVGNSLMIYVAMMGAFKRRRYRLVVWGLLNPVYWILHSIASYKALWQLTFRPHYWEKTKHGLTARRHRTPEAADRQRAETVAA